MNRIQQIIEELSTSYPGIHFVKSIKRGKEAEVFLLQQKDKELALKVYAHGLKFRSRKDYFMMSEILDTRQGRAIKTRSKLGQKLTVSLWTEREFNALVHLYDYGVNVPETYKFGHDYLLQQFIGNEGFAAPQLYRVKLTDEEASHAYDFIVNDVRLMWDCGYVHGDLSSYNILWDGRNPVIIDFPQVILNANNEDAPIKLLRDIDNISDYFKKYKIPDFDRKTTQLKELAWGYWG